MQLVIALMIFMVGLYYTVCLRGYPFYSVLHLRGGAQGNGALSPFAALASALCGTLGVGSVIAVVSAVAQGGAGVLLYLWLGALTGCSLKYAEIVITMRHRDGMLSGAMTALREKSPLLGTVYALLCLPVALMGMGNLTQVQVLSETLNHVVDLPRPLIACVVATLLALLLLGGLQRIGRVASVCLPVIGGAYIMLCLSVLWRFRDALPTAFSAIFTQAVQSNASVFALGVARGLFISEAGMGTAAFAHSQSQAQPSFQGALGVCEVLFSTFLCTLTALVVLVTGVPLAGGAVHIALSAFEAAMGRAGAALLCVMLAFFALSTLPVWWFYGRQCVVFLGAKRWGLILYTLVFVTLSFIGCLKGLSSIWAFTDIFNLLLAVPSLMMLLLYRKEEMI